MKKAVWMSYDLGVKGDYEGLYQWLDSLGARECSGTLSYFNFEARADLAAEVKKSLQKSVTLDSRSRIYIVFLGTDKKLKGRFLFSSRKAAAWAGFAPGETEEDG